MDRIRASLLWLGVLASVVLLGIGVSPAQAPPPRDPYSLEVAALTVRTLNVPRGSVDVLVTARDDSAVGWIDLDCAGDRRRIDGEGRLFVTALVRCTPVAGTTLEVRATVVSPDGVRSGEPVVALILVLDHEAESTAQRGFPRNRLRDSAYPTRVGSFDSWAEQLVPLVADGRPWWLRWEDSTARKPFDFASKCPPGVDHVAPDGLALRCWLDLHPHVRKQIVWHEYVSPVPRTEGPGKPRGIVDKLMPYDTWTEDMKIWLDVSVYWAYTYLDGGLETFSGQFLPAVPPNLLDFEDCEGATTIVTHDDAWKLYLGTIAHSLAVELGRFVPWSVVGYSDPDLRLLFHSDELIKAGHVGFGSIELYGYRPRFTIPAPPTTTFEFLVNRDLIRPTAFTTVGQLLEFGRYAQHFFHEFGVPGVCGAVGFPWYALSREIVQGYRGTVPVARLLEGTNPVTPPGPPDVHAGWVNGCSGGANLFQHVLRMVNIPVEGGADAELGQAQHHAPFFFTLGYTMSHFDDIFNWWNASIPPFPGWWLLLPMETYEHWFLGAGKLGNSGWANVSRQALIEVPLKALSNELVQRFCLDKASGASHGDGTLAAYFRVEGTDLVYYDVAQLEALDLWSKLEAKAAVLGFCAP
jgi:hypothetical protein